MPGRFLLLAGGLWSLTMAGAHAEHAVARDVRRPEVSPVYFAIDDQDRAMRDAVRQARGSVGQFTRAMQAHRAGDDHFMIKKAYRQDGRVEHLWLTDLVYTGHRFAGRVDNRPRQITGLKLGSYCSANPGEITDWAYLHHGRLVGGYTIRALYARLTPSQKQLMRHEIAFSLD
jgi:uncharacterized protein YegJ (DUF2314 family)